MSGEKLLLIDDDPDVLRVARRILVNAGFSVFSTTDAIEAGRILGDPDVSIDLLITDIFMPEMNGPDVARKGFRARSELRTLFMSGDPQGRSNIRRGDPYLGKPFAPDELLRRVEETLAYRNRKIVGDRVGNERRRTAAGRAAPH